MKHVNRGEQNHLIFPHLQQSSLFTLTSYFSSRCDCWNVSMGGDCSSPDPWCLQAIFWGSSKWWNLEEHSCFRRFSERKCSLSQWVQQLLRGIVSSNLFFLLDIFSKKSFLKCDWFKDTLCSFLYKNKSEVFPPRYIVLSGIFINTEAALTNNNDNRSKERGMWIVDVSTLFVFLFKI